MRKYKKRSNLVNNTGYTNGSRTESNPVNYIPSENITMADTSYPVDAMPLDEYGYPIGDAITMYPGEEYKFGGASYVAETPSYKDGGKSNWISEKIGTLMKEGRPQKQAIVIAYSMWNQKHEMGGTQLPKYQFAGTAELDQYGQPLPKPLPAPSFNQTNTATAQNLFAPGSYPNNDRDNNGIPDTIQKPEGNPLVNATPDYNKMYMDMPLADEQLKTNDGGDTARKKAEASGMGITQFVNPYGDVGLDDALAFTGKSAANGNVGATVGGAALSLLKGTKSFLQGMGAQKRQNQVMKNYAEEQRKNMTGEGREQSMAYGGYYQYGGRDKSNYEEEINRDIDMNYPNFGPQDIPEVKAATDWYEEGMDKDTYYGFKNQLEAEGYKSVPKTESESNEPVKEQEAANYDKNSARDTWVAKTGMPWSEAKRLGYTDGSAKNNIKLLSELNNPKFKAENLRKAPVTRKVANTKKETATTTTTTKTTPKVPAVVEKKKDTYVDPYKGLYEDEDGDIRNSKGIMVGLDGHELNWLERNFTDQGVIPPMDKNGRRMKVPGYNATIEDWNAWHKARAENKAAEKELKAKQKAAKEKVAASRKKPVQSKPYVNPFPPTYPSYNPTDPMNLNSYKFFQDGGMQTEMGEEQMMMGNPQEEQAGGDQMQAIVQQVAQMLQQGADPQEILQQLVQAGLPEEQAMQVIQMVIEQMQGGQPQATPQLGRGGKMYQEGGGFGSNMAKSGNSNMSVMKNYMDDFGSNMAKSGNSNMSVMKSYMDDFGSNMAKSGNSNMSVMKNYMGTGMTQAELNSIAKKYNKTPKEFLEIIREGEVSPDGGTMIRLGGGNTGVPKNYLKAYREEQNSIPNTIRRIPEMMKKTANKGLDYLGIDYEFNNGGYYQDGGAEGETPNMEQIESQVEQALKQGADPQQILEQLVQMGMPEEQAIQMIQEILQEIQGGETEMEGPEQGQPMMKNGGEYLAMMKGKTIKNYTYNKKTGNYDVEFE